MCSKVTKWWNEEKIAWYKRASESSSFHKELALFIAKHLSVNDTIAELGCGLGYFSNALDELGYNISGYDIDTDAIDFATKYFQKDIFETKDCLNSKLNADVAICIFFGKITRDDNFIKLMGMTEKKLIYVTGGGSERHIPTDEIESFFNENNIKFEKEETTIPFHQPFIDKDEAERFLSVYYKGNTLEEKRKMIHQSDDEKYKYILKNNKKLTIYIIEKE